MRKSDGIDYQRVLRTLEEARRSLEAGTSLVSTRIAVVGVGLRVPGARSVDEFWSNSLSGSAVVHDFDDRWDLTTFFDPEPGRAGKLYAKRGGRIDDVDLFDAKFFGVSPREACVIDPQHRLLLELTQEALEDARVEWRTLAGSDTAVFVGITSNDYALLADDRSLIDTYFVTGNALNGAAGRLAFTFGLQGPTAAVDTACSSSLTALHLATQALRNGECSLALAAGVNMLLSPYPSVALCSARLLAPDGRAKVFDARADGLVRAEGGVVVALKRLPDALRDGNPIFSLICGSAVNQDGASSSITVPNGNAQRRAIRKALEVAAVDPQTIGYVEAHGAATQLGDPIELGALDSEYGTRTTSLYVGSTKALTGHLEAGAGLLGFVRASLVAREGEIPPQPNFERGNPGFKWDSSQVRVATERTPWVGEGPRRTAVSAFGISGTNVHAIVEGPPAVGSLCDQHLRGPFLYTISALDTPHLRAQVQAWLDWRPEFGASDASVAYASNVTRRLFPERLCVSASSTDELREILTGYVTGGAPTGLRRGRARRGIEAEIALVCCDPAGLRASEIAGLLCIVRRYAPSHLSDERLAQVLAHASWADPIRRFLEGATSWDELGAGRWPVGVWIQLGVAEALTTLGVRPVRATGDGAGDLTAACVAGVLSARDAMSLAARLGELLCRQRGETVSVRLPLSDIESRLTAEVLVVRHDTQVTTIAGEAKAVACLCDGLEADGIWTRRVASAALRSPDLLSLTGVSLDLGASERWCCPSAEAVQKRLADLPRARSDEAASCEALTCEPWRAALVLGKLGSAPAAGQSRLGLLLEVASEQDLQLNLGQLWIEYGLQARWQLLQGAASTAAIPKSVFLRERHWLDAVPGARLAGPLLGKEQRSALSDQRATEYVTRIDTERMPSLRDHVVFGHVVFPMVGYVELACELARRGMSGDTETPISLSALEVLIPLAVPAAGVDVHVVLHASVDRARVVEFMTHQDGDWLHHARLKLEAVPPLTQVDSNTLSALRETCGERLEVAGGYAWLSALGIELGARFRRLSEVHRGKNYSVLGRVDASPLEHYELSPATLDGCFHVLAPLCKELGIAEALLPVGIDRLTAYGTLRADAVWVHGRPRPESDLQSEVVADFEVFGMDGELLVRIEGFRSRRARSRPESLRLYETRWLAHDVSLPPSAVVSTPGAMLGKEVSCELLHDPSGIEPLWKTESALLFRFDRIDESVLFDKALSVCRELARLSVTTARTTSLIFVTKAGACIAGEPVSPSASAVHSLLKCFASEHANVNLALLDVDEHANEAMLQNAALQLVGSREKVLALRRAQTLHPRLVPSSSHAAPNSQTSARVCQEDGLYVVTGGTRGVGLEVASWLAEVGARRIALLSRRGVVDEEQARALRSRGVEVYVMACDVSSREALATSLRELREHAPIRGLIHCAALVEDGLLMTASHERAHAVWEPKVGGAQHLIELTRPDPLDFLVLFSSAAGLFGAPGQSVYAAANGYLDGLALRERSRGNLSVLAVQWGPWSEVGVANALSARHRRLMETRGFRYMAPAAGLRALAEVLRERRALSAPLCLDLPRLARTLGTFGWDAFLAELVPPMLQRQGELATQFQPVASAQSISAGTQSLPGERELSDYLKRQIARATGLRAASIADDADVFDLGLDSLMLLGIVNGVKRDFALAVTPNDVFDRSSIASFAAYLAQRLRPEEVQPPVIADDLVADDPDTRWPLSSAQKRMWFLDQLEGPQAALNVVIPLRLRGPLDAARLVRAFSALSMRHPILRGRLGVGTDGPYQTVSAAPCVLERVALAPSPETREQRMRALLEGESRKPIAIVHEPWVRARLFELAADDFLLAIVVHHIAFDGWSLAVLLQDLLALYRGDSLEPVPAYFEFVREQAHEQGLVQRWQQRLADAPPALAIPYDAPPSGQPSYDGAAHVVDIPADLRRDLAALAARERTTLAPVLMACFYGLLHRWTGDTDLVVGVPIANRPSGAEATLGLFVNMLPVRAQVRPETSLLDLVLDTKNRLFDAVNDRDLPFEQIVRHLNTERELAQHPVFQVLFAYQNYPTLTSSIEGMSVERLAPPGVASPFPLAVEIIPEGDKLSCVFSFQTQLLEPATVERLAQRYLTALRSLIRDPMRAVGTLEISVPEDEACERLCIGSAVQWPNGDAWAAVHAACEQHAQERALQDSHGAWSYRELATHVDQLAAALALRGVREGEGVALFLPRTRAMVAAALAVLRLGARFVPLDRSWPTRRIEEILHQGTIAHVVADTPAEVSAAVPVYPLAELVQQGEHVAVPPLLGEDPTRLAYEIFTSGSTGTPKGVRISHGSLLNALYGIGSAIGLRATQRVAAITTTSFDISVFELFGPLLFGAEVLLSAHAVSAEDISELSGWLARSAPDVIQTTPSCYRLLLHAGFRPSAQQSLIVGGEALASDLQAALCAHGATVFNFYGPTETTIWSTYQRCSAAGLAKRRASVSIGLPLPNETVAIWNVAGTPQPPGCAGELVIGGAGLAAGYGDPMLEEGRFVTLQNAERVYRTGDRAVQNLDGSFHFLGRIDTQTKIRGFRVELEEVRQALLACGGVLDAVPVPARSRSGQTTLHGFVQVVDPESFDAPQALMEIGRSLPSYMVPSQLTPLVRFPLTSAGKIDTRALAALAPLSLSQTNRSIPPATAREAQLWVMLCDVLGRSGGGGVTDNFFSLGGDSMAALELTERAQLAGFAFSVRDLFKHPTVRALAALEIQVPASVEPTAPLALCPEGSLSRLRGRFATLEDAWPLLPMQHALYVQAEKGAAQGVYVEQLVIEAAAFDQARLRVAWETVQREEPLLRSAVLEANSGQLFQVIGEQAAAPFAAERLEGELDAWLERDRTRGFEQSLARLTLLESATRSACVFTFHHLLFDGYSVAALVDEIFAAYSGKGVAPASPAPFRDYVALCQRRDAGELASYWRERLCTVEGPTPLPLAPPVERRPKEYRKLQHALCATDMEVLQHAARTAGVTLNTLCHAAWTLVLASYSGTSSVVFGSTESGRTHVPSELRKTRGLLINTFPFSATCDWSETTASWLRALDSAYRGDVENAAFPLAEIQGLLRGILPHGRALFETALIFERFPWVQAGSRAVSGVQVMDLRFLERLEFPLVLEIVPSAELDVLCRYDATRFDERGVGALLRHFEGALLGLARGLEAPLSAISLCTTEESEARLERWDRRAEAGPSIPVIARIERQVAQAPDSPAVRDETGAVLTYAELWRKSEAVAFRLRLLGQETQHSVGLLAAREVDAVAAVLGILRAGCTYVPLDPELPTERVALMLEQAHCTCVIASHSLVGSVKVPVLELGTAVAPCEERLSAVTLASSDVAYVIFTSGSTGVPKGTEVSHDSLGVFLEACAERFPMRASDSVLATTTLTFDISLLELLHPLCSGASLSLLTRDTTRDARRLQAVLEKTRPTFLQGTPSFYRMLIQAGWHGDASLTIICGGEPLTRELADTLLDRCARAFNAYGPTEATVWSSFHEVTVERDELAARGAVSIGSPALGESLYVLGPNGQPTPAGGIGELYIGGRGVAIGYRGQPELTERAFARNLLSCRVYRTGDYVRVSRDATAIEFVGRRDGQLKLRGFRIEVHEIERALCNWAEAHEAVVVPTRDGSGLVAAVVTKSPKAPGDIIAALRTRLPDYMIPNHVLVLSEIPKLLNGKADRSRILEQGSKRLDLGAPVPPRTPTEELVAAIWEEVLSLERVSVTASFFDVGGHSLLANLIIARIEEEFGVRLTIARLFEAPTVENLAREIDNEQRARIEHDPELMKFLEELEAGAA